MGAVIALTQTRWRIPAHHLHLDLRRSPMMTSNLETMDPDTVFLHHLQALVLLHHRQLQHAVVHHLRRLALARTAPLTTANNSIKRIWCHL